MSLICGWLNPSTDTASRETLESMILAPRAGSQNSPAVHLRKNAAVATRTITTPAHRFQDAHHLAVVDGHLHWKDRELAELGTREGHAAALVRGFRQHGHKVFEQVSGAFACVLLKPAENYALLAVDHAGQRPLAYTLVNGGLIFASHLDSLTAFPGFQAKIDPQSLFDYLYFHMVPSPQTIYRGVHKLQPGECVEFIAGQMRRHFHFHPPYGEQGGYADLAPRLKPLLSHALASCLDDRPTGTFLSGGLDSSTVSGLYREQAGRPIDAFAIGFDAEGYDEMPYARACARHFDLNLHEYYVTPDDVFDAIPMIAASYDEPFGNASAIPVYYCARQARLTGMACLLAGDGGDEIFAGNERYAKQKLFDAYRLVPAYAKPLLERIASLPGLEKLQSYIKQARIPLPQRLQTYNFLHRSPLRDIFASGFLQQIRTELPLELQQQTWKRCGDDVALLKKMLFLDAKFTLADNDLRKVNRTAELAGIEVRYPLLQREVVEFAARIPSDLLLKGLQLRWFFRRALRDFLAPETLAKHKHGFGLPFGIWLQTDPRLNELARDHLERIARRGFLNPDYIRAVQKAHREGHAAYYGVMIWLLIMLEAWLDAKRLEIPVS
ncbi:asparagine synthase (glutamine-hydrolysing) [Methylomarinovum tepidoasis]|uniref:asparagine synthase (glutamine-hydrolyzing) n=1 Tax=Methylomarinovum tepidoasis TaxID=2840183 RepID=A0AAU9C1I8_9GAMM|nr:asparagine synthase-related protein [Methylomarinovum sp. IN45]BCX89803.1 asparagine synthase (glutamine-hydrolysing) [Methylomarinovum sp. IN45]